MTTKEKIKEIIDNQPDDATYEEIIRELAFSGMVERGLEDAREGRMISNKEMGKRIRLWQKSAWTQKTTSQAKKRSKGSPCLHCYNS